MSLAGAVVWGVIPFIPEGTPTTSRKYLALRLARFTKFAAVEQETIRAQKHSTLVYLKPEKFSLPEENAAMLDSLVRVHKTAIDTKPCGQLDEYELRTVQERFLRFHGLDLRALLQVPAAGRHGAGGSQGQEGGWAQVGPRH